LQTFFHGANVKLNDVEPPTTVPAPELLKNLVDVRPGRIVVDRSRNLLFVRCQENWVAFRHVTVHRRPVMSALDFFNGFLQKKSNGQHYFDVP
jgi:methionyl-tRNA formyltransferase